MGLININKNFKKLYNLKDFKRNSIIYRAELFIFDGKTYYDLEEYEIVKIFDGEEYFNVDFKNYNSSFRLKLYKGEEPYEKALTGFKLIESPFNGEKLIIKDIENDSYILDERKTMFILGFNKNDIDTFCKRENITYKNKYENRYIK